MVGKCVGRDGGPFPFWLGDMTGLRQLDLSNNGWTGSIPPLWRLVNLEELDLSGNALSGPLSWWGLTRLKTLDVSGNALTGRVPPWFGLMAGLESLSVGGNPLEGPLPLGLVNLPRLHELNFGGTASVCAPTHFLFQSWLMRLESWEGEICQ